jgi:ketosteroid isomerase-like protein
MNPDLDTRLERVEKAYAGFRAGSLADFVAPFDDDSVMIEASSLPYGGTYRGREDIAAALMQVGEVWTNLSYDIEEIIAGRIMSLPMAISTPPRGVQDARCPSN